jgi:hypothetical protein
MPNVTRRLVRQNGQRNLLRSRNTRRNYGHPNNRNGGIANSARRNAELREAQNRWNQGMRESYGNFTYNPIRKARNYGHPNNRNGGIANSARRNAELREAQSRWNRDMREQYGNFRG